MSSCDRYLASSIAYGEAHGLDPRGSTTCSGSCRAATLTILLDIAPETAAARKSTTATATSATSRCSGRVRESYRRQAAGERLGRHRRRAAER